MRKNIIVTGASSGFGAMTVRTLAEAGHRVYAGIRDTTDRNATTVAELEEYAAAQGVDVRAVELDVSLQQSVDAAVGEVLSESGVIDVVVHNAGHMVLGPAEAFTPEELAAVYDVNVLSTPRVNRAVLPHLRTRGDGLLVWSVRPVRGVARRRTSPRTSRRRQPRTAVSYAAEPARFGIDTTIVVPGSFTTGTNHFAHAGHPADATTAAAYESLYAGLVDQVGTRLAKLAPSSADPTEVARQIARVVDLPKGARPFRIHIDLVNDGSEAPTSSETDSANASTNALT
jgi:NAD(P)-dependent dehydrogenase (short-subunit alcohol dehydrogenase family)